MGSRSDVEVGGDCAFKSRLSSKFVMAYVSGLWRPEAAEGMRQTTSPPLDKLSSMPLLRLSFCGVGISSCEDKWFVSLIVFLVFS
jgi:hypothetical protein